MVLETLIRFQKRIRQWQPEILGVGKEHKWIEGQNTSVWIDSN